MPPTSKVTFFKEQQKYVYSILLNTVKDPVLNSIIINANKDDVQKCWDNLVKLAEQSTSAEIKAADLLQYIMSVKFDDGKWQGSSKDFIIHWCEQVHQYESLCKDNASHFSEPVKTQMLQNTVDNVTNFCTISTIAQQTWQATMSTTPHSFQDYKALLLLATDAYDMKHAMKRYSICNAFYHNLVDLTVAYKYDRYGHDIDTDIVTIYANAAKTRTNMVPTEQFCQMSQEGCKVWACLSDNDCSLIFKQDLTSTSTLTNST